MMVIKNGFQSKFNVKCYLDFVIISSRDEKRLLAVETDSTYRPVMLVKLLQQGTHTIVPQLDDSTVQTTCNERIGYSNVTKKYDEKNNIQKCRDTHLVRIHGRLGWKERPLTLADLVSNLVSILVTI